MSSDEQKSVTLSLEIYYHSSATTRPLSPVSAFVYAPDPLVRPQKSRLRNPYKHNEEDVSRYIAAITHAHESPSSLYAFPLSYDSREPQAAIR